jgi:hypothetical protein
MQTVYTRFLSQSVDYLSVRQFSFVSSIHGISGQENTPFAMAQYLARTFPGYRVEKGEGMIFK